MPSKKKLAKHIQCIVDVHVSMNTFIVSQTVKRDGKHFEKQSADSWLEVLLEDCVAKKGSLILF